MDVGMPDKIIVTLIVAHFCCQTKLLGRCIYGGAVVPDGTASGLRAYVAVPVLPIASV